VGFAGANALNTRSARYSRRKYNEVIKNTSRGTALDNNDGLNNYSNSTRRDPFPWTYPPEDEGSSAIGLMKYWQELEIIKGYDWTFDFEQFLAALQRQPVLVGMWWYEGLGEPDENGLVHLAGDQIGGHEMLANAVLWHDRLIGWEQSWGEGFGFDGKLYTTWEDTEQMILNEGDVVCPRFL